ncbi:polyribonucleotide nucleotidyltransferase [Legionella pneumophila]|uniref:Polyribonucleotide nucleotidyltransferase n=1 Tax=Legionella pneumophila subsp. pascullei TaxID=91890 RepID=A0AAX2J0F9_LEGPN|nr:polyribonucleotide nucleotidyltransferase [Legionella pneumophila]AMP90709.1 polyribonucleotide nucleotidyltransferase [Legionella pneumophila subsp. pascullei]AMP93692.1 polyribonucleotide nucleotidyltransferase [Legionella pneumophila subsp. pascullei]AMP96610.1 polyribonucleotide nucleotidyltransferase [Legionella pneumophila subsp. pascullei]SQG91650.1 polyribonucleotide nucleotidyltransferase [Legionella pneumophila subsp. pascullei]VEH08196.1 polyribonucleotide nucleotidyltransferase 
MAKITKEIVLGNHKLTLETGEVARQADGAVMASMNGTQVLVTVVWKKDGGESNDFFPLTVNYQEKFYAIGKIPGGFNKREGRPSDNETLISRLIDRPIRPLFPDNFFNEVQIIATVLSLNPEVSPDIIAMIGASAALSISGVPFNGPIGAARVGYKDGIYLLNPSRKEQEESALDLVIAGTKDAILMVESEAQELSEDIMRGAMLYGHEMMKSVIKAIEELAREVGKDKPEWKAPEIDTVLKARINDVARNEVEAAYLIKDKQQRYQRLDELREQTISALLAENDELKTDVIANMFGELERSIVRNRILEGEPRIDGRDHRTVRPISIRTKFLERTHGSCLFTRGETQAIVVATLGNERDAQILDGISGETRDRFMLHYNFPPYSVGETGQVGSPKRREIGHGRLAKRALMAVLPDTNEFPYVLRIVSEITESNGSSSMATVCGTSLALMDAGVPLKAPVAGVAMGLIKEGDRYAVLTDILGDEDHLGDMDFKVAGTEKGITALQMDIKISGITNEIMEQALEQALEGRIHILGVMNNALAEHRTELSQHAPRITTMKVAEDKIRTIIGKGGATIKGLIESTGVSIDIDDSGVIQLFSPDKMALEEAQKQIKALIAEIEVGQTYQGKVSKIVDFGAFINLLPGKDGLLHISQICADRTQKVEEVLQEGQEIEVFVAGIDKQGRVKLEWKDKPQAEAKEEESAPVSATFLTIEEQSEEINSDNKISEEEE